MKLLFSTIIALIAGTALSAQGIEFFHGTWEEALAEAEKQEKIIFVDAYAVWCGPCKRMAKEVFTDEKVGDFHNKNFINMKLDMEKAESTSFRRNHSVSAYPTLFYIDYTGKLIMQVKGARQAQDLINLGKEALSKIDRSGDYAAEYEKGNRDPELIYNYVKTLNQAGKSSLKVANEYLDEQENLRTEFNLRFLLEATTEADSKIFEDMIKYRSEIEALESKAAVQEKILAACYATAQKAIEFESQNLLEEAKDKMKKHYPERYDEFEIEAEMDFCKAVYNAKDYLSACKDYAKNAKGNPEALHKLVSDMASNFGDDPKVMKKAEDYAKEAAEAANTYEYYMTYASLLYQNGKKSEALNAAYKSKELAKDQGPRATQAVDMLINKIEG